MTPYFIFVRDTLSYLVLLALHVFICLAPSQIPFSGLEWAIFVFFLGRIAMEGKQFVRTHVLQGLEDNQGGTDSDKGHNDSVIMWKLGTYFR